MQRSCTAADPSRGPLLELEQQFPCSLWAIHLPHAAEHSETSPERDHEAPARRQSHFQLLQEHEELRSKREETRACLAQACNYHFCLPPRVAPNHPPQTWKTPNYRRGVLESNGSIEACKNPLFIATRCQKAVDKQQQQQQQTPGENKQTLRVGAPASPHRYRLYSWTRNKKNIKRHINHIL